MAYQLDVVTHIKAPADTVWEWMSDVRNLLSVNMFHEDVIADEPVTEAGARVPVPHSMFGVIRQRRICHIRDYEKYFIGFGETKAKDEPGTDPFPHYQSFEVVPRRDGTCLVINTLRGLYQFPGAQYFGERIFRRWSPAILEDDNANIAIAVGALDPKDKPRLKGGLVLWPLMSLGGRVLSKGARRKVVTAGKAKGDVKAPRSKHATSGTPAGKA